MQKLPLSRSVAWISLAWQHIRRQPRPLFTIAMFLGIAGVLPFVNLLLMFSITLFYGGMVWVANAQYHQRGAMLSDSLRCFSNGPQAMALLLANLPNLAFTLYAGTALYQLIGADTLAMMQAGKPVDEAALKALFPALLSLMLRLLPMFLVSAWLGFIAIPRIVLQGESGVAALGEAFKGLWSNILLMVLFSLLFGAVLFTVCTLLAVPVSLLALMGGGVALLARSFFITIIGGFALSMYVCAMYYAWRDWNENASAITKEIPAIAEEKSRIEVEL